MAVQNIAVKLCGVLQAQSEQGNYYRCYTATAAYGSKYKLLKPTAKLNITYLIINLAVTYLFLFTSFVKCFVCVLHCLSVYRGYSPRMASFRPRAARITNHELGVR